MTKRTPRIRRVLAISLVAAFASAASAASADRPPLEVRKLRKRHPVALFKCHDLSKLILLVTQEDFRSGRSKGPWAASKDADNPMFLRVWVDSEPYCVKAHLVEANSPVPATKTDAECKTSSGKQPKPAFVRGVGEGC